MATFQKRSGKWRAIIRKAGHTSLTRTFPTKSAAKHWAREVERDIDLGERLGKRSAEALTFGQLAEQYEREIYPLKEPGRTKRATIVALRRKLGRVPVARLTSQRLIEFARQRREEGAGPVTVGSDLSFIGTILRSGRSLFGYAISDEPVRDARLALGTIGLVGKSHERSRRPTDQEMQTLYTLWDRNRRQFIPMSDICRFAITSAMRLSEITSLRWIDLDSEKRTVIIRNRKDPRRKQGNDQRVPLFDEAWALVNRQHKRSDRIFPYDPRSVSAAFTRGVAACGIEDLRFHDLRHEGASRLFERGFQIEQVALITGHKDWGMLRRYTQLKPEDLHNV